VYTWFVPAHSTIVRAKGSLVHRIPSAMSFEQAASLPIIYGTVYYCLSTVAQLQRGETVLIHHSCWRWGVLDRLQSCLRNKSAPPCSLQCDQTSNGHSSWTSMAYPKTTPFPLERAISGTRSRPSRMAQVWATRFPARFRRTR
jgi:hypothetical protein